MTIKPPFGKQMRAAHWQFAPNYTPLNHGSFGAFPQAVSEAQTYYKTLAQERPDTFIVNDLPNLIHRSRAVVSPLLGCDVGEVVLIPNATTGINTVLRNIKWESGDVVIFFSTIYSACEKTIASIAEMAPLESICIPLEYPIEDVEIVQRLRDTVASTRRQGGKKARMAIFDTVLTFPGARVPWEALVQTCRELGLLSLIDGAHGIGSIDLSRLGESSPDFFVSNCHKWLYTPRGCAVFYVPFRNQHLIRTSIPTSHGYRHLGSEEPFPEGRTRFEMLFEFVATIDYTPYCCAPAALKFRSDICGGEEAIREYCFDIARRGGERVAEILGTTVMNTKGGEMRHCAFANVELPLIFKKRGEDHRWKSDAISGGEDVTKVATWLNAIAVKEFDTYLQIAFHAGSMWVRLSGQIYLEMKDFEWAGGKIKDLCARARDEFKLS